MATPNYATALQQINDYIVANGNNEITANVLNPVLKMILDFANNNIGDLKTLTTDQKNTIVEAINSLKNNFDDLVNNGVQLYTGINDPNGTPPPSYKYADFYMQVDIDSLPVKLWQWNGFVWTDESQEPEHNALAGLQGGAVNDYQHLTTDQLQKLQDLFEYTKTISVGSGGTYSSLENLFLNEPVGKTLINLTDAVYNCVNPKFLVKEGWIIKGQGVGKTKITFTFNATIDPDLSGLQIRQQCKLEDFELITVNNVASGGFSQYALHSDYPTYPFKSEINRCSFKTILSAQSADLNGFNGLSVGIGSWENQSIDFNNCYLEGAYVTYSDKYTLNLHNPYSATTHLLPSKITYKNCLMTGGFTTVLISDVYSNDSEPNQNRVQDLYEFINCDISSLWLRSHSQTGTIDKKNGILYNFTGTKVREFLNTAEVVDTSLGNYSIKSIPVTEDVEFLKNIGLSTINAGDFVSYVYSNRLPEYHLTSEKTINTPIGVEKLSASNYKNFAGIALVNSASGNFVHFAKGAIAYTSLASTVLNVGDNVNFDVSGNLVKANDAGIGKVVKKTYQNKLGILINASGKPNNVIGSSSYRGVIEVEGNASTVGAPTIRITDNNTGVYGWQMTVGTNANAGPVEIGRFAINDLNKGFERLGIDSVGEVLFTARGLTVQNTGTDSSPYTMFSLGTESKAGYFKMANAYNTGNGFEIFQASNGKVSLNFNNTLNGAILDPTTVQKLQVNGEVSGSAATLSNSFVTKAQLDAVAPTSGTYTPTLVNTLNVTTATLNHAHYIRIGDVVTVTISLTANVTTGGSASQITFNLPVNRVNTALETCGNFTGYLQSAPVYYGGIFQALTGSATDVRIYFTPFTSGVNTFVGSFSYTIN